MQRCPQALLPRGLDLQENTANPKNGEVNRTTSQDSILIVMGAQYYIRAIDICRNVAKIGSKLDLFWVDHHAHD